ncbi:putative phage tail protein [Peribacillus sp. NPDC056705]|uniref:putative phage tail protein n=1 Tax=Peribacillus sp. NPDC056705 TaxID=3345918 RepID=UPI003747CF03
MSGAERLKAYLPDYYDGVLEMDVLLSSEGVETEQLVNEIERLLDQFYPESTTWAMTRYEKDLHITPEASKPLEQRRSVIISKMRGNGKVSGSLLKSVAQAYERGAIEVTVQPSEYKLTIKFIDTYGLPPNMNDLKAAIEEIKPAHLSANYALRYLTIAEVEGMTITQNESTTQDRYLGGGA